MSKDLTEEEIVQAYEANLANFGEPDLILDEDGYVIKDKNDITEYGERLFKKVKEGTRMTKQEIEEIRALSSEVYGSRGRAEKITTQGRPVAITKTVMKDVTKEDGTVVQEPKKELVTDKSGRPQFSMEYPSLVEVKADMIAQKAKLEEFKVQIAKMQEEAKLKQEEEQRKIEALNDASGSARV